MKWSGRFDENSKCMNFEWDKNKALSNLKKHGVSSDEAKTVFEDLLYVDIPIIPMVNSDLLSSVSPIKCVC